MANERTDYLENASIDYFFRPAQATPHRPTSVLVGLLTVITNAEAGTVTETSYAGYAAQAAGFGAEADSGGLQTSTNSAQINFPAVAGGPITIVGYGIKDDLSNWLVIKTLAASVTYQTGDIPFIPAAGLSHGEG